MNAKTAATLLAVAAAATLSAAPAHADPDDDAAYLLVLHAHGLSSGYGDAGLVRTGHGICLDFASGTSFYGVVGDLRRNNPDLGYGDAGFLIGAATTAYCPAFSSLIPGATAGTGVVIA